MKTPEDDIKHKINRGSAKFSHHSLNRAEMVGLSCNDLVKSWWRSDYYELGIKEQEYKFKLYGLESLDTFYTFDQVKRIIFTCHRDGKYIIIITVTRKNSPKS